jgi:hypothetical protein
MHEETESAEAIPNPMIRETTTLDFVLDQYLDLRTISGTFCTNSSRTSNQSRLEVSLHFLHPVASLSRSKCCRVLGRPEILMVAFTPSPNLLYLW